MSRIYWDSMLFIYALEGHPEFAPKLVTLLEEMKRRGDTLCTSVITVGEVLVGPIKMGSHSGADRVRAYFTSGAVEVLPLTFEAALQFAHIRAWTGAGPPDALHLATASTADIDLFITNDKKLHSLKIPGIPLIAGLDREARGKVQP